jgi:hypothetical protein
MRTRFRRALACAAFAPAAVVVLTTSGAAPAVAANEPGSGFQSLSLRATSGGQQFFGDKLAATAPGSAAGGVPWTTSDMSRSSAHALASVAWPGDLGGNAGSLLLLLGPSPCVPGDDPATHQPIPLVGGTCDEAAPVPTQVMDQYHYLNTPVRAEAQYPTEPTASQGVPGAAMEAAATATTGAAVATVGGGYVSDAVSFGTSTAVSQLRVTGPRSAESSGSSLLKNLDLAGGVVHADSITSHAEVTTSGDTATAAGGTSISGLEVGGIPVTIDGNGLHAAGQTASAGPALDAAKSLLANAGVRMYLTSPTKLVRAGSGTYRAAALVVTMDVDQTGPKDDLMVVLGGAEANASATLPYQVNLPPLLGTSGGTAGTTSGGVPGGVQPALGQPGAVSQPGVAVAPGQAPRVSGLPLKLSALRLPAGWSAGAIAALAVLFAGLGLLAFRLQGPLLAAPVVNRCEDEEPRRA